ncbi:MAG: DUF1538 domain-containing protein [Chitinispirillaceae bacterium]
MPERDEKIGRQGKIKVTFSQGISLLAPYVKKRFLNQLRSVTFITLYLLLFQTLVLRVSVANAVAVSLGMATVIVGLMFFMEGLFLGIMPLGELLGIKLPRRAKLPLVLMFSFVLGIVATLAEPAIGILRTAGSAVKAWDAPLLFLLLDRHPDYIVYAIATGVGLAVVFGMLRFLYNWSLKPFVVTIMLLLLIVSAWATMNTNLSFLVGVAWDSGGVTTGPVTVPLVLALGVGVCRIVGGTGLGTSGFGVVTLASLFPILVVQLVGFAFLDKVPEPMSVERFVSEENRAEVLQLFQSEQDMIDYVSNNVSSDKAKRLPSPWPRRIERAADEGGTTENGSAFSVPRINVEMVSEIILQNVIVAIRAIVPLTLFLIIVLKLILKEKLAHSDVLFTGILFSLVGVAFFNIGMYFGLSQLGNQVGKVLPATFRTVELEEKRQMISNFDTSLINSAVTPEGKREKFFYYKQDGTIERIFYSPGHYIPENNQYEYIPIRGPVWETLGILLLILFTFVMGYGATFAEPALNALGVTVEELTVGTFRQSTIMHTVAFGVGIGLAFGIVKIVWDIPLIYLLIPPYILVLALTLISSEDYVNIGWDSAGVTTGPVTVPLVLAMGLGVGSQMGVVDGFGMLALASVWPILTVLFVGVVVNLRKKAYASKIVESQQGNGLR